MADLSPAARRALAVALLAAIGGGLAWQMPRPQQGSEETTDRMPQAESETAPPEPTAEAIGPEAAEPPRFDLVRVEPDGRAVVAGTAEPGATVTLNVGDLAVSEVEADAAGNFVAIFATEPSAEPQALALSATAPDGTATVAEEVVVLLPRAPPAPASPPAAAPAEPAALPAEEDAEPEPTEGQEVAGGEPDPSGEAAAEETEDDGGDAEIAVAAIVGPDEIELLPPARPGARRQVSLAAISYAAAGEVNLAGIGTANAVLRIYVDGVYAQEARVAADGRWRLALDDLPEGVYRLRIDQLGPDGQVASRVETPFQRDVPRGPLPRPGAAVAAGDGVTITVQPGNNLWTLARTHYGSGVFFTQLFTANSELIRDPDLIYPGQIFAMPEVD